VFNPSIITVPFEEPRYEGTAAFYDWVVRYYTFRGNWFIGSSECASIENPNTICLHVNQIFRKSWKGFNLNKDLRWR
jgi:hypothetical protein